MQQQDQWTQLFAFVVNTLGGGIVGAIAALCVIEEQTARKGFNRTVVSVIVSGAGHVPAIWFIRRCLWSDFPDEFIFRFFVQLILGTFGFYLAHWFMNEFKGTEDMKLSDVLKGFLKSFGPLSSRMGSRMNKIGEDEKP